MKVVSIEELKQIAKQQEGEIITLPGFTDDTTVNVKVKRVSLMDLVQCEILPNPLLIQVNAIFHKRQAGHEFTKKEEEVSKEQLEKFTDIVYRNALVEPTIETFNEVGLKLTEVQKRLIAEYAIGDTSRLNQFRKVRENIKNNSTSSNVPQTSKRDNENK